MDIVGFLLILGALVIVVIVAKLIKMNNINTKVLAVIGAMCISTASLAGDAKNLPFIGHATFNFAGGMGTQEHVIIKQNGQIEIGMNGRVSYEGSYSDMIDIYRDGSTYFHFTGDSVTMKTKDGKTINTCSKYGHILDGTFPCKQELNFNYKKDTTNGQFIFDTFEIDWYAYELLNGRLDRKLKYSSISKGNIMWDHNDLVKKTNSKGIKIYCLSYKNVCKTEEEVVRYIKQKLNLE